MGITGLLPFLKNASRQASLDEFKGCTAAVDTYCWLHKGVFSCADKLAMGEKTDGHVVYVMKLVNLLLSKNIKPVMVFDGCHLPSKADVEKDRRQRREQYKKKAAQFLREGKRSEAKECFQRAIDITPQMASDVIKACRAAGADCLVAPYEADAQLAYLAKIGIVDLVITEDSDLIPFGCDKVLYKMDFRGGGVLVEKERLNRCTQIQDNYYTFEKFRQMCILSGCDYLTKIPGVGLVKANKLFKISSNPDIRKVLKKIPTFLNLKVTVSDDFVEDFIKAENTFLYQLVFDPLKKRLVPLTPHPEGKTAQDFPYAGPIITDERAYQIAIGNINIYSGKPMDNFDPKTFKRFEKDKSWDRSKIPPHKQSIWTQQYKIRSKQTPLEEEILPSTKNMTVSAKFSLKRARKAEECDETKTDEDLTSMYSQMEREPKRRKVETDVNDNLVENSGDFEANEDEVDGLELEDASGQSSDSVTRKESGVSAVDVLYEELLAAADSPEKWETKSPTESQNSPSPSKKKNDSKRRESENMEEEMEEREVLKELYSPTRNIFAVGKNEPKRERFDLNAPKTKPKKEVKSRFFAALNDCESGESPKVELFEEKCVRRFSRSPKKEIQNDRKKNLNRLSAFSWSQKSDASTSDRKIEISSQPVKTSKTSKSEDVTDNEWENLRSEILPDLNDSIESKSQPLDSELPSKWKLSPSRRRSSPRKLNTPKLMNSFKYSKSLSSLSKTPKDSSSKNSTLNTSGDSKSLQDELNDILTGAKADLSKSYSMKSSQSSRSLQDELSAMVSSKDNDTKPKTGCRSVGLSKKSSRNKTPQVKKGSETVEQPKLTSFLAKFKNEKPVAKLERTRKPANLEGRPELHVDLTEDPEEVNYLAFVDG